MARSMFDFIASTNALLEGIDAHDEWMQHLDNVRDTRAQAMADYTTRITSEFDDRAKAVAARSHSSIQEAYHAAGMYVVPIDKVNHPKKIGLSGPYRYHTGEVLYYDYTNRAYFDPTEKRNLSMQEAKEKMGIHRRLAEDQNRSDAEVSVFFDDRNTALAAYEVAQQLGLKRGEVTYDPTVDPRYGVGQYAVRLAPHIRETKPEIFYDFLESIYDHIVEEDVDQFEWLMAEAKYGGVSDKEAQDAKGNPLHTQRGEFGNSKTLPGGSFSQGRTNSDTRLKAKDKKTKDGRLQFAATKLTCGRGARTSRKIYNDGKGTPYSDPNYGRRCWDGKIPDWAAKGASTARRSRAK
jgi:hypothetical protein